MDIENIISNPIDVVEDVIHSKKWNFSRADDHELVAEISSEWCQYRLYFTWSEQIRAISFTITFDLKFPSSKSPEVQELLALINEKLLSTPPDKPTIQSYFNFLPLCLISFISFDKFKSHFFKLFCLVIKSWQ